MKKKILVKILTVVMTASILLYGCGQQTESQEESVQSSQVVQEVDESTGQNSMFQGTIFDNLVMGETTVTDVEELLDGKFLEYEYEDINKEDYEDDDGRQLIDIYSVIGKTTITDEFYEWNALYRYTVTRRIIVPTYGSFTAK